MGDFLEEPLTKPRLPQAGAAGQEGRRGEGGDGGSGRRAGGPSLVAAAVHAEAGEQEEPGEAGRG